jgi:hypothetical protein
MDRGGLLASTLPPTSGPDSQQSSVSKQVTTPVLMDTGAITGGTSEEDGLISSAELDDDDCIPCEVDTNDGGYE